MAPRGLSSGPDSLSGSLSEYSPTIRESVSTPRDARAEFLDIVAHTDTPGVQESVRSIEAALAAAPTDAMRAALLTEVSANATEIQMLVGDDQALVELVKKILADATRTSQVIEISATVKKIDGGEFTKGDIQEHDESRISTINSAKNLVAKFASPERLAESEIFKRDAQRIAAISNPKEREEATLRLQAKVILQDESVQAEARERMGVAEYERSIQSLQVMFPDIRPVETIPRKAYVAPAYEQELMKRVGAKSDMPVTRAGNRVTFATQETNADGYVKATLDVSREPPTVLRHGPNGTLVPMDLNGNRSFDRAYGLMRATETLSAEIGRLEQRRDQLVDNIGKIAMSLHLTSSESDETPLDMVDGLIERAEARFAQDRLGTPPGVESMDTALSEALEGGGATVIANVETSMSEEAMRGAEQLLSQLRGYREELAKLEDEIALKTAEKTRLDGEKTAADEEFARHMAEAARNAEANMKSLEDTGAGELGQEGLTVLVKLLNQPNVMAVMPHSVSIDLAKPLTSDQKRYIAHGMESVFGDAAGLYDETGTLRPEARENREALRHRLVERGVLDEAGEVRPFVLEQVFMASLDAPRDEPR